MRIDAQGSGVWRGQGTVLVIDDQPSLREVIGSMLQDRGFTVLAAEDGDAAIAAFPEDPAEIRAVLLDVNLPGLPAPEVFDRLKEMAPGLPILLSSAWPEPHARAGFGERPLAGYLRKPFRPRELYDMLRRILEPSPTQA